MKVTIAIIYCLFSKNKKKSSIYIIYKVNDHIYIYSIFMTNNQKKKKTI